jgi:hypothetical protein
MEIEKAKRALQKGKVEPPSKQEQEQDASLIVQCLIRGIIARQEISRMRDEEMVFLGMDRAVVPKKKKKKSIWDDDPISFMEQTYEMRRQQREETQYLFEKER